jgi:uncharacterized protein (DUF1800 family)
MGKFSIFLLLLLSVVNCSVASDINNSANTNNTAQNQSGNADLYSGVYYLPDNEWRQFSFPVDTGVTLDEIFSDDMPAGYGTNWSLFEYDPVNGVYANSDLSSPAVQGKSYWVYQLSGNALMIDLPDVSKPTPVVHSSQCPVANGCFSIALPVYSATHPWLMLGNPFPTAIKWNEIRVISDSGICSDNDGCTLQEASDNSIFYHKGWKYNGTKYDVLEGVASIDAWSGFWGVMLSGSEGMNLQLLIPAGDFDQQVMRLLNQTTFGATRETVAAVHAKGITGWINEQLNMPSAYDALPKDGLTLVHHLNRTIAIAQQARPNQDWFGTDNTFNKKDALTFVRKYQSSAWLEAALTSSDQLRQRVALALSELMVVSTGASPLDRRGEALAYYYDILARHAFGHFRDLLEDVTKSPTMGVYLSHQGNRKADPATNTTADENYAREVMQLFTIGLYEFNQDGSAKTDANGQLIPTYSQTDIEEMAKVFTGWDLVENSRYGRSAPKQGSYLQQMEFNPNYHDYSAKTILGVTIPAQTEGSTPPSDLPAALDVLFNHPNTAPFVSRHLIMRLVTSNPTPGYIERVANVFVNNGKGVRGDLKAVVAAILTDDEARTATVANFGKYKEPLLAMTGILRAFHARPLDGWKSSKNQPMQGVYWFPAPENDLGQGALRSPTVFNFFSPGFVPSNVYFQSNGLVAPELQIQTDQILINISNVLQVLTSRYEKNAILESSTLGEYAATQRHNRKLVLMIDFDQELELMRQALQGDFDNLDLKTVDENGKTLKQKAIDQLVQHLEFSLLGEETDASFRDGLKTFLAGIKSLNNSKEARLIIKDAVRFIATSSYYMVQK